MLVALDAPRVTAFLTLYFETCELLNVAEMQREIPKEKNELCTE